jgi:putative phage-type endonuclease
MTAITVRDDTHWRDLRRAHIGASEVSSLFGLSPYLTEWQLWMMKSGRLPEPDLDDVAHIRAGRHFEPAISAYAQEKFGITLRKVRRYLSDDICTGMGASLDYEQIGTGSLIPTEIKWSVFGDGWEYEGDVITSAPEQYLIQVQQQIACAGARRAQVIAYISGDARRMIVDRREPIIDSLREQIAAFWASIRAGKEPDPDFVADADAISTLAFLNPLCQIDLSGDEEAARLAALHVAAKAEAKEAGDRSTAAKAELTLKLLRMAMEAGATVDEQKIIAAIGDDYRVTATNVAETAGKTVTEDMVGEVIGGRKGYRLVTISQPKKKCAK